MPISNLASATGSANSTISGVVDRLEKVGLIQRIRSEQDRRVIYVATTEKFEQLCSEAANTVLGNFEALVSTLSEEDLQQVEKGLSILEQALTAEPAQE
ncbi:MAG: MarR family transcriptional regulator [Clostridiales bacterium]|nr:MarR family transcriptional regulator [Clostridiales bacterium]